VLLDMNFGTLSFAKDGEFLGIAFKDEMLKKGPIYPAFSLIHHAGCKIISGMPTPKYMLAPV